MSAHQGGVWVRPNETVVGSARTQRKVGLVQESFKVSERFPARENVVSTKQPSGLNLG